MSVASFYGLDTLADDGALGGGCSVSIGGAHLYNITTLCEWQGLLYTHVGPIVAHRLDAAV